MFKKISVFVILIVFITLIGCDNDKNLCPQCGKELPCTECETKTPTVDENTPTVGEDITPTIDSYIVTFENNGLGKTIAPISDLNYLPNPLILLFEDGYDFLGWYLDAEFKNKAIAGAKIETNTTLYAKWQEKNYKVIFENNGHGKEYKTLEGLINLPKPLPVLMEDNYLFLGWYLDENFSEMAEAGSKINSDTTLYAKWESIVVEPTTYKVSFEMNGHGEDISSLENLTSLPSQLPLVDDLVDYCFLGWYLDENLTELATPGIEISKDMILYAKWELKTYTISFDGVEQVLDYNSVIVAPADPTKEGYTFLGWYMDEVEFEEGLKATSDMAFVSKFELNTYKVSFNNNGHGTPLFDLPYSSALPDPLPVLIKDGYTFEGWFTDSELTTAAVAGKAITADTTLYAKWTENVVEFTITFVTNIGEAPVEIVSSIIPNELPELTAEGYTFEGWYLDADCTIEVVKGAALPANIKLYAKWEATDISTPEHTCDFTGEWVSDETHHWHECECGEIDTKVEHSGGEATLTEKAKCEVCGVEYGELLKEPTPETPTNPEQTEQPDVSTDELEDMPYDPNYDPFTDVTIQPSGGCNGGCKGSLIPTLFGTIGLLCSVLVIKTKKNKH